MVANQSKFSISIEQLRGLESIPRFDKIRKLPLISWFEATSWCKNSMTKSSEYVVVDITVSDKAYALKIYAIWRLYSIP